MQDRERYLIRALSDCDAIVQIQIRTDQKEKIMTEKVLQEITEKRDRYTKHFMLPEKGTAAAVYP